MNDLPINSESNIEIVIADDHPIFRRGLKAIIEAETDLKVVAEADNGETALEVILICQPDIAVLDLDMPKMDGFEITRAIQGKNLATDIIFLTMHNSETIFNAAFDLGVEGYVLKDGALPEIIDAIRQVYAGQRFISQPLEPLYTNRENRTGYFENKAKLDNLTTAERSVLKLIAQDKTSRQIAEKLFISVRTVDRHRSNISEKLDLRGANALLKFAVEHKAELK
jgi:DNA-binding NarL/FixJ family response regulator